MRILWIMPDPLFTYSLDLFKGAAKRFAADLEALDHEDLIKTYDNGTRCAYDFVYETALINQRQAMTLRGEDPGPLPWEFGKEWLKAPDELSDKTPAFAYFQDCAQELIAAAEKMADSPCIEDGAPTKVVKTLIFATGHTMYHDAQLNFIQSLKGDMELHWG